METINTEFAEVLESDNHRQDKDSSDGKNDAIKKLIEIILQTTDHDSVSEQISEVSETLKNELAKLSRSNSRLERKKAELTSEMLQLVHTYRSLKSNNRLEKIVNQERADVKEQYLKLLKKDKDEREKRLQSEDKSYYKRYSDISSIKEANSLLKKAESKLEMWENIKSLTSHKAAQLEEEKPSKKKGRSSKKGVSREPGKESSQTNSTKNTRQMSILESFSSAISRENDDIDRAIDLSVTGTATDNPAMLTAEELSTPTSVRRGRQLLQSLMNPFAPSIAISDNNDSNSGSTGRDGALDPTSRSGNRRQQLILESLRNIAETSRSSIAPRVEI